MTEDILYSIHKDLFGISFGLPLGVTSGTGSDCKVKEIDSVDVQPVDSNEALQRSRATRMSLLSKVLKRSCFTLESALF